MGRHKTISDDQVLGIARDLFRARGHDVTTREIAQAAGISEAVLYQRFGSKDDLFFAAMRPKGPDVDALLGPGEPLEDARTYLRAVILRIGRHFAEAIPLALRVMTHPSFNSDSLSRAHPNTAAVLRDGLAERLTVLARRKQIATRSVGATARVLVSLAHDWALAGALSPGGPPRRSAELTQMVDLLWEGLRPAAAPPSR